MSARKESTMPSDRIIRYVGIMPALKNILNTKRKLKNLCRGISFLLSAYAVSTLTTSESATVANVTQTELSRLDQNRLSENNISYAAVLNE